MLDQKYNNINHQYLFKHKFTQLIKILCKGGICDDRKTLPNY